MQWLSSALPVRMAAMAVTHPPHFQENGLLEPTACGMDHSAFKGYLEDWKGVSSVIIVENELHSQHIYIIIYNYIE